MPSRAYTLANHCTTSDQPSWKGLPDDKLVEHEHARCQLGAWHTHGLCADMPTLLVANAKTLKAMKLFPEQIAQIKQRAVGCGFKGLETIGERCTHLVSLVVVQHRPVTFTPHFQVLGLAPGALMPEIKMRFRELAARWHPDKNQGSLEAKEMFQKVLAAWQAINEGGGAMDDEQDRFEKLIFQNQQFLQQPILYIEECTSDAHRDIYALLVQHGGTTLVKWGTVPGWQHPHGDKWLLKLAEVIAGLRTRPRHGKEWFEKLTSNEVKTELQARPYDCNGPITVYCAMMEGAMDGEKKYAFEGLAAALGYINDYDILEPYISAYERQDKKQRSKARMRDELPPKYARTAAGKRQWNASFEEAQRLPPWVPPDQMGLQFAPLALEEGLARILRA